MEIRKDSVIVIDPISSGRRYGEEIRRKGFHALALVTRKCFSGRLQKLHSVDGFDEVMYVENLEEARAKLSCVTVRAVIPGSDSALRMVDKLAEAFSAVGNPVATHLMRMDKLAMKNFLCLKGVPATPAYRLSMDELVKGYDIGASFPVVVKPSQSTGARNVKVCQSRSDVYKALASIEQAEEPYCKEERHALVEAYVEGQEYFIVTANLGASAARQILCFAEYEKIQVGGNPSVYKNIRSISPVSDKARQAFSYVCQVNSAIEADNGINDVEFKVNSSGHFVIEQNGRLPGANVPTLIELCTGLNCYDLNINIYLGNPPQMLPAPNYGVHFCICCLISDAGGTVEGFDGMDIVRKLDSFHEMNFLVAEGEVIEATRDFLSSWGFVYLLHPDPQVLRRDSEIVHNWLKPKIT
ncbi:hypothetical protein D3C77_147110 [compost metagenome]